MTNIYCVTHKPLNLPKVPGLFSIQVGNSPENFADFRDNSQENIAYKFTLSYLTADAGGIPSPDGTLSVAALENLLNTTAPFCGDISDNCFEVNVLSIPDTVFIVDGFCDGQGYDVD